MWKFVEYIKEEIKRLYATFPRQPMTKLTDVLKKEHETAEKCHICLKEFNDPSNRKVRDHCHYTGLCRGAAHNNCNLKYQILDHIPIVFHNLSDYDAHMFIKELGRRFNKNDIGVIAENKEKYISFNVKINVKLAGVKYKDGTQVHKNIQLRFIDSCRFMASSLDKLASNLCGTSGIQCDKFKGNMEPINISGDYIASLGCKRCRTKKTEDLDEGTFKKNFNHPDRFWECDEKFHLMIRKVVYPYEYMDDYKKFEEAGLSRKDVFYSRLNMKGISDQDYEHAQQVRNTMQKKTPGCCHDNYLKTYVLLLADVFETFWNACLKKYKLDPAHFYTSPGLAWQTLLKTAAEYCEHEKRRKDCELCPSEFRLELLTDIDILLMAEKGIQGGITQAVKRYVRANNKYMKDLYNPEEESIFLQYLNAKSLYGWAMVQNLPTHGFLWKDTEDFTPEKIDELVKKDKRGYLLEVDVKYREELHKNHNELPFLVERMKIERKEKLAPNLKHKKGYVIHIKALA